MHLRPLEEDGTGKYEISFEVYERYSSGGFRTKKFTAKNDMEAFKKISQKGVGIFEGCLIEVDGKIWSEDLETYIPVSNLELNDEDEIVKSDPEIDPGDWLEGCKVYRNVESILEELDSSNGDGTDYILYIKRPDGSYLYQGEWDDDDDWDDE